MNLGRLAITDGADYTPAAPTGLALAKRFDGTGEIQLTWDLGDYDSVKLYRVYAGLRRRHGALCGRRVRG